MVVPTVLAITARRSWRLCSDSGKARCAKSMAVMGRIPLWTAFLAVRRAFASPAKKTAVERGAQSAECLELGAELFGAAGLRDLAGAKLEPSAGPAPQSRSLIQ